MVRSGRFRIKDILRLLNAMSPYRFNRDEY